MEVILQQVEVAIELTTLGDIELSKISYIH
jgi:hypothetical protein